MGCSEIVCDWNMARIEVRSNKGDIGGDSEWGRAVFAEKNLNLDDYRPDFSETNWRVNRIYITGCVWKQIGIARVDGELCFFFLSDDGGSGKWRGMGNKLEPK